MIRSRAASHDVFGNLQRPPRRPAPGPCEGAGRQVASSLAVLVTLGGCASLAVRPCDTIADRDGKYFGRFFLGVATVGLSEVTIQQEEVRQAYEGSPG